MTFLKHLLWSLVVTFAVAGAGCGDDDTTPDAAPASDIDAGDLTADAG